MFLRLILGELILAVVIVVKCKTLVVRMETGCNHGSNAAASFSFERSHRAWNISVGPCYRTQFQNPLVSGRRHLGGPRSWPQSD